MPRQSKAERLLDIHQEALRDFDKIQAALRDERLQSLQDRRFYAIAGAQWEGPLGEQFENKPRYEFNKIHLAVIRIINEYRNNRITVAFQPKDGSDDDGLADTCEGLLRADERAFTADEAYDTAFEEAAAGGFGAWRLRVVPENEEDPEGRLRIRFEPITDADSCVFFDLDAKRQDKADAKRCYVLTAYTHDAYKEEFGDDAASWPKIVHQHEFDWMTPRFVWVCELYRVEYEKTTVHYYRGLDPDAEDMRVEDWEFEEDPEKADFLQATGFHEVRQEPIKRRVVIKYLMSGGKMLSDGDEIPGGCIPIIPTYGRRMVIDGIERCQGHVRLAKDAQRLTNMLLSFLAEMTARFDVEKPIFDPRQIAGHAQMWADDNVKRYPFLFANLLKDNQGNIIPGSQAPTAYTRAPQIPPAMAALAEMGNGVLEDLLGNQEAGEQVQANLSGRAVELVQQRLDMQVYHYVSNLAKAQKRSGEVWLAMMKEIAVEESRRMKTLDKQGATSSVQLNHPVIDEKTGQQKIANDISSATFDVDVDIGPSSSSARSATVRALSSMMALTQDPQMQQVLGQMVMMNMQGEGVSEARDYFRKQLVQQGVIKPTKEEAQAMAEAQANAQPDPQSQYLLASADAAQAAAANDRAKTIKTIADAGLAHAQTQKTLAEIPGVHQSHGLAALQGLADFGTAHANAGLTHVQAHKLASEPPKPR